MKTLPMRFRILHLLTTHPEGLSEIEIMDALKPEYGTEGQFKRSIVDNHLASMKAVGLVEIKELYLDEKGELAHKFIATETGYSYRKYLPKEWLDKEPSKSVSM